MGKYAVMFDKGDKKSMSRTKQAFAKDSDINTIVARYHKTGLLAQVAEKPLFADVSHGLDYHGMLMKIEQIQNEFYTLPAEIREKFDNDPGKAIAFLGDPANDKEAVNLFLKKAVEAKAETVSSGSTVNAGVESKPEEGASGTAQ